MSLLSPTNPTKLKLPPFFLSFSSTSCSPSYTSSLYSIPSFSSLSIRSPLPIHLLSSRSARCRASEPGPPPPHRNDPPRGRHSRRPTGFAGSVVSLQDRVRIFFAVLFWMSLLFWASAWDGRNRPNKGSRFKRWK